MQTGKLRLAILNSINGIDLEAIVDALAKEQVQAEIVLIISDRRNAEILETAKTLGIDNLCVDYKDFATRESAERKIAEEIAQRGMDLLLLMGFMKILSSGFVSQFAGRIWNTHPSLLPKYSGIMDMDIYPLVLENHDKETGCTLHEVVAEVDAGRIIMQKSCEVSEKDTPETLKAKVQNLEQECVLKALQDFTSK